MAETLTLAVPEVIPAINTTDYRVVYLQLDFEGAQIMIRLRGTNNELRAFNYGGPPPATDADRTKARNLMIALNKANLSLVSLQHRILNQLVSDGFLAGAVTGLPD